VVVDFSGTLKGEEFEGGTGTEVPVVLGQGQMLPDFEKALRKKACGSIATALSHRLRTPARWVPH
jgi:trigger factor